MRKLTILICLILPLCFFANAQITDSIAWRKVDSINKIIKTTKGRQLVDCYNLLAQCYFQIWDDDHEKEFDTACIYANKAYEEAKNINYPTGVGYAKTALIWRAIAKIDDNKNNNDTEPAYLETYKLSQEALTLADQLKDDYLAGAIYGNLVWVEKWKGSKEKLKENVQKSIQRFEKVSDIHFKNSFKPLGYFSCPGCKGTEISLALLYGDFSVILLQENSPIAKDAIKSTIHYSDIIGNKYRVGDLYRQLAQVYFLNYDYTLAEQNYLKAKEYFHEDGSVEDEIGMFNEMSKIYEVRGDFEKGIAAFKTSIKLLEEYLKNKSSVILKKRSGGQAFFWMSRLYIIAGDYEEALNVIRQGRQYYSARPDSFFRAPWFSAIGDAHRLLGNYDSAMYYLKYFQNSDNDPNNFGKVCLGYLYLDIKDYGKALSLILPYYQSLKTINRITPPIVKALMIAGNASLGEKKYNLALKYAKEAEVYINQMDGRVLKIDNYKLLSDIYYQLNVSDSAYDYLKKYTTLKDSLINRQFYFKLNSLKTESEEQKKTSQINLLNKDNQIQQQKLKQEATLRNSLVTILILLLSFGLFVFRYLFLKRKSDLQKQKLESEKKQADLEMQALRAQMNPHFIFNCLSSINKYILKNEPDKASDYLTRFSRLIRMVLMNSQRSLITLEDELEMLTIYLDMERMRFKNTFNYNIVFSNRVDAGTIFIPPLLLQPFCENAIWHGLRPLADGQQGDHEPGRLDIILSMEDKVLNCIITDNGIGRKKAAEIKSKSAEEKKSLGLKITAERLALLNEEKNAFTSYEIEDMKDENGNATGTRVNLKISFKDTVEELIQ